MIETLTLNPTELLDVSRHNRKTFACGVKELDSFLQEKARKESPSLSRTFVLTCLELPGEILGYYSLSSTRLSSDELPEKLKKRIGQYGSIPATLLGRLASSQQYQRSELRVGEILLIDAMLRTFQACRNVASFGLIVDILKSDSSDPTKFYERYGFLSCMETPGKAYLPMNTIEATLKQAELISN